MTSWYRLKTLRDTLAKLEKIKKKMDPASGLTVSVRRGPSQDDDDLQADGQTITIEVGTQLDEIMSAIIAATSDSIKFNESFCKSELKELREVLGITQEWKTA